MRPAVDVATHDKANPSPRRGFWWELSQHRRKKTMNAQQIRDYYDSHPNVTLRQLSAMTGRSISELKCILMGHP
jgi:hypothetical protein